MKLRKKDWTAIGAMVLFLAVIIVESRLL